MYFSVLVPVYNVEAYLEDCIQSVLQQTDQNFEIVLVDDGSSDSSPAICNRFLAQYPDKVKVLHKENEGVVSARNDAIRQAAGEVVVFLDADDCLRKDALMRLHEAFDTHHCDMVIYNYSQSASFCDTCAEIPFESGKYLDTEDKKRLYQLLCSVSYLNSLWTKAVRTEIAQLLPKQTQWASVTNGEDLLCTLPMVTAAEKIVYLDEPLYFYRKRPGSAVHTFSPKKLQSIKTVHQEFERYIDLWQMPQLHPIHYARQVRGWVEAVVFLLTSSDKNQRLLRDMAADPYFLRAYPQMDRKELSPADRLLAKWLYNQNYCFLHTAVFLHKIKFRLKQRS